MEDRDNLCIIAESYGKLVERGLVLKEEYKDYDANGRVEFIYQEVLEGWYLGVNTISSEEESNLSVYSERVLKDYFK